MIVTILSAIVVGFLFILACIPFGIALYKIIDFLDYKYDL